MITQPYSPDQIRYQPPNPIPGVVFRLAQQQDLKKLWENCYPDSIWDQFLDHYQYLLKWQVNGRCYILIAETTDQSLDENQIIGSGQLIRQPDKAEIAELVVHDSFQNQGIGTAIIEILTRIAIARQVDLLEIGAAVQNEHALRLYRRLGFENERHIQLPGSQEAVFLSKIISHKDK